VKRIGKEKKLTNQAEYSLREKCSYHLAVTSAFVKIIHFSVNILHHHNKRSLAKQRLLNEYWRGKHKYLVFVIGMVDGGGGKGSLSKQI
jgi:hypothetical protein